VFLGPYQVGFRQPRAELLIDVARLLESKRVQMVSRRERLDPAKARVVETSGQDHVPVEPVPPRRQLRERHPHLKSNPGLFGQNPYRADRPDDGHHFAIERPDRRRLAAEMMGKCVPAARVRLICGWRIGVRMSGIATAVAAQASSCHVAAEGRQQACVAGPLSRRATGRVGDSRVGAMLEQKADDRQLFVDRPGRASGAGRLDREVQRRRTPRATVGRGAQQSRDLLLALKNRLENSFH
jgi:hypothetical protein